MLRSRNMLLSGPVAALTMGVLASVLVLSAGRADDGNRGGAQGEAGGDRALRLLTLVPVPVSNLNNTAGAMYSFDISFVDQKIQTYFLADRSNKAVDVVNAKTNAFLGQIFANFKGFTPCSPPAGPNDCAGPNGVVSAFPWLFVTDGGSRVVSFDLRTRPTPTLVSDVTTSSSPKRADELAYDPQHGILLVINNADDPPFGTLINVNRTTGQLTVDPRRLVFDTAHTGVNAQGGAEQPVWDPGSNRFFLSIPQIEPYAHNPPQAGVDPVPPGAVIRINPFSATVDAQYSVPLCGPAGLTLGPSPGSNGSNQGNQGNGNGQGSQNKQDLFIGCNTVPDTAGKLWDPNGTVAADPRDVIINASTGTIDATVYGVGAGDEVWFNPGDGNYYATGSGSPQRPLPSSTAKGSTPAGVVDSKDETLLQLFPTYNVPALAGPGGVLTGPNAHPAGTSHSIAANASNNHVFVPLPANNAVLSTDGTPEGTKNCLTGCIAIFGHPDE